MSAFWSSMAGSFVGSGAIAAVITAAASRSRDKRARRGAKADAARDELGACDLEFRRGRQRWRRKVTQTEAQSRLMTEVDKLADPSMRAVVEMFLDRGRLYSARDKDTGYQQYTDALNALRDAIDEKLKSL